MNNSALRRHTAIAALVAIVAAALSPLGVATTAVATAGYVGTASGDSWVDAGLDLMSQGVSYSSTLTLPSSNGPWGNVAAHNLPAGLSMGVSGVTVTISGTPTSGGIIADFSFTADGGDGAHTELTFTEIYISPSVPATSTALVTNVEASPYTGLNLTATVTGASPTGTVTFSIDGSTIGTGTLSGGVATFTGAISSSYVGLFATVVATYSGDEGNAGSASTPVNVFIFGSSTVSGTVTRNGAPLSTNVELLNVTGSPTVVQAMTSVGGSFSFTIADIDTIAEASHAYLIRAQGFLGSVYYAISGGVGVANRTFSDATSTSPITWGSGFTIYDNLAPTWQDLTLATPRVGSAYSDHIRAANPALVYYTVTAGTLPAGLTLDEESGELHGTPTSELSETFTVTAGNLYGSVTTSSPSPPCQPGLHQPGWRAPSTT